MNLLSQKGIAQILVLILLFVGIGLGVYLVRQKTNLIFKAQETKIADYSTIKATTWYEFPCEFLIDRNCFEKFKQDVPKIKANGFNTIWFGGNMWKLYDPKPLASPHEFNQTAFDSLKQYLQVLRENKIRAILGLNYLGQGWAPEGVDACNWINRSDQYGAFETYTKELLSQIQDYSDMVYITVFTELADGCGEGYQANYADPTKFAAILRETLGSLPERIPPELRNRFRFGYHDYSLIKLDWGKGQPWRPNYPLAEGQYPIRLPISYDFVSTTAYDLENKSDQEINNELDLYVSRFRALYPNTPLIFGESGNSDCKNSSSEDNQARTDKDFVEYFKKNNLGFTIWFWQPIPNSSCDNTGLAIVNVDRSPKKAAIEIKKLLVSETEPASFTPTSTPVPTPQVINSNSFPLSAEPNPCTIESGQSSCITTINWSVSSPPGNVCIIANSQDAFACAEQGPKQLSGITEDGVNLVFYGNYNHNISVSDNINSGQLIKLDELTVKGKKAPQVTQSPAPTPSRVPVTPKSSPSDSGRLTNSRRPTIIPTPSPAGTRGDANGDSKVNFTDLSILFSKFGRPASENLALDLNNDGVINSIDIAQLIKLILK